MNDLSTKFKPMHNFVLLEFLKPEETTVGGVILLDSAREAAAKKEVRVVAVNSGRVTEMLGLIPCPFQIGDKVYITSGTGFPVNIDGTEYYLMRESDIIGIFSITNRSVTQGSISPVDTSATREAEVVSLKSSSKRGKIK